MTRRANIIASLFVFVILGCLIYLIASRRELKTVDALRTQWSVDRTSFMVFDHTMSSSTQGMTILRLSDKKTQFVAGEWRVLPGADHSSIYISGSFPNLKDFVQGTHVYFMNGDGYIHDVTPKNLSLAHVDQVMESPDGSYLALIEHDQDGSRFCIHPKWDEGAKTVTSERFGWGNRHAFVWPDQRRTMVLDPEAEDAETPQATTTVSMIVTNDQVPYTSTQSVYPWHKTIALFNAQHLPVFLKAPEDAVRFTDVGDHRHLFIQDAHTIWLADVDAAQMTALYTGDQRVGDWELLFPPTKKTK